MIATPWLTERHGYDPTWPREIEGWLRRPVKSVANQRGNARAMFIDSCVVGVKV